MAEPELDGWSHPIRQGLAEPFLLGGVPPLVAVALFVVHMIWALISLGLGDILGMGRAVVMGGGLYAAFAALTAWEPHWFPMLKRYLSYHTYYEG